MVAPEIRSSLGTQVAEYARVLTSGHVRSFLSSNKSPTGRGARDFFRPRSRARQGTSIEEQAVAINDVVQCRIVGAIHSQVTINSLFYLLRDNQTTPADINDEVQGNIIVPL